LADAVQGCPPLRGPVVDIEQRDSPGPVNGVERGRHAVAADQLGVEQSFRLWWVADVVVSAAALAGV
jgi:hypothetical protein